MFTYTLDKGALLTLVIVALILYTVLCTAALFPATWRMTSKEKEKICDKALYQKKYTNVFVLVNAVLSCVMVFLIWIV